MDRLRCYGTLRVGRSAPCCAPVPLLRLSRVPYRGVKIHPQKNINIAAMAPSDTPAAVTPVTTLVTLLMVFSPGVGAT
jgi:hypothetical protein